MSLTFPRNLNQTPITSQAQYPGLDSAVHYSEGLNVGYRGYDRLGIEPQYPFGYGLSYTRFGYSQLQLTPKVSNGTQSIEVRFEIANTGVRAGIEIAQVYLGLPTGVSAPPKKLVGWARVHLEPGERKSVTVTLNTQSAEQPLSFWNADTQSWEVASGDYAVYVGSSSRDTPLTDNFHVGGEW